MMRDAKCIQDDRVDFHFVLQWHVTIKCPQDCVHCYIDTDDVMWRRRLRGELGYEDCVSIIDDFAETFHCWGMPTRINFTGGDPLLRRDIFDLIAHARSKGVMVGILGNPNFLDYSTAKELKRLGIDCYQVSIDGMEETHDRMRKKKGLFQKTIQAIHILEDVGIPSMVMFTLCRLNAEELIDVMHVMATEGASFFDFGRLVPTGRAKRLRDQMLDPQQYRDLLCRVSNECDLLRESGCRTHFGKKENLWKLLDLDLGLPTPLHRSNGSICDGCGMGYSFLTILPDGAVLPCARLPVWIGQLPQQRMKDIFLGSEELNALRNVRSLQKCAHCELLFLCRGCPAIAYAVYGSYSAPDPQCWKENPIGQWTTPRL